MNHSFSHCFVTSCTLGTVWWGLGRGGGALLRLHMVNWCCNQYIHFFSPFLPFNTRFCCVSGLRVVTVVSAMRKRTKTVVGVQLPTHIHINLHAFTTAQPAHLNRHPHRHSRCPRSQDVFCMILKTVCMWVHLRRLGWRQELIKKWCNLL